MRDVPGPHSSRTRRFLEKHFGMRPFGEGHQHGAWTFYFEAPDGFTIEVLC